MGKIITAVILALVPALPTSPAPSAPVEAKVVKAISTDAAHARARARRVKARERRLAAKEAQVAAAVIVNPTPEPQPEVSGSTGPAPLCDWGCIQCESGGDPTIWSSTGKYWGLYQFDSQTWYAHGAPAGSFGNGSAELQHEIASRVTYDAWPNC